MATKLVVMVDSNDTASLRRTVSDERLECSHTILTHQQPMYVRMYVHTNVHHMCTHTGEVLVLPVILHFENGLSLLPNFINNSLQRSQGKSTFSYFG